MAEYFSPGVYVEEYDNSPRSIEGVGTSTAGFVGLAEKGQTVGAPLLVTSYRSFVKQFGGPLSEFGYGEYRYLAPSVEQFFANGGTRCYVSRVIPPDAKKAFVQKGILGVEAVDEGKWGNRIQVTLNTATRKKMQLVGKNGEAYVAKSVDGFREGDLVVCNEEYNRIQSIFDNSVTFERAFGQEIVDTALIPKTLVYLVETDMSVRYGEDVENYTGLSFNTANPNYISYRLANSELIRITVQTPETAGNPVEAILGEGNTAGIFTLEGGQDGSMSGVNAGTFIGEDNGPGKRTGLASFVENNTVSMLAIPGGPLRELKEQVCCSGYAERDV